MQQQLETCDDTVAKTDLAIRPMTHMDAGGVLSIYREGIETGHATFASEIPSWQAWDDGHLPEARLVAVRNGIVAGWVAFAGVSARPVYQGVAEISIYVGRDFRGAGVGSALMAAGVRASEHAGLWTLQAGIFPENKASLTLHADHGFVVVGRRQRLGCMEHGPMRGQWRDIIFMERRSETVGMG